MIRHPHPVRRAATQVPVHGLHIGHPVDGPGCVAHCGCHRWGRWYADRRHAVLAYHQHLAAEPRSAA